MKALLLDAAESDFLRRLRAGDESAFAELVGQHGGRLLVAARRLLGNEADASDAVQEAFLAAFRGLERFEGTARLSTWLHRIVINAALMRLRKRSSHVEQSIDALLPTFRDDGHAQRPATRWGVSAATALEREETRRLVREKINELPELYRTVLLVRDIEGMDTDEAAQALQMTPGAVKTRLHRARQALRALLDPYFREGSA